MVADAVAVDAAVAVVVVEDLVGAQVPKKEAREARIKAAARARLLLYVQLFFNFLVLY